MAVYKNDEVTLTLRVGVDVSVATVCKIKYLRPDGLAGTWTAVPSGTTAIAYTTNANDLCVAGDWKIQAYVENVWKRHGTICKLRILDIL